MKSLIRNAYILGVLLLASISAMGTTALAADSHTVTNGAAPEIDEHGTCNKVTNSSGQSIMVPTKTTGEWSSFRSNLPSGVSLASCAVSCGGYAYGGYCYYMGSQGQSCDAVCSGRGGCNLTGTRDHIGSGGSLSNCNAVFSALGVGGAAATSISGAADGYGCSRTFVYGMYLKIHATSPATNCTSSVSTLERACACNS